MKPAFLTLMFIAATSALYGNVPVTSAYLGTDYLAVNSSDPYTLYNCGTIGCGGEFTGTLNTTIGGVIQSSTLKTNLWCIDSQEDFNWNDSGYADVVKLSSITTNSSEVHYSNVTNSGTPQWTTTAGLPSDVTSRFEMAAWLVEQYGSNAGTNNSIQQAIWDITSNTTYASTQESGGDAGWISKAASCYNASCAGYAGAIDPNAWAVVSWDASSTGVLTAPNRQTFLVQLATPTPEPGFYQLLGFGTIGLLVIVSRRTRKAARTEAVS